MPRSCSCPQVECADFVVLNKTDLLTGPASTGEGSALDELVAIVSSLNPLATVVQCQQGQVCGLVDCGR